MKKIMRILVAIMVVCFTTMIVSLTVSILKRTVVGSSQNPNLPHVVVLDLNGVIYTSNTFIKNIEAIGENKMSKAVVIRINSPGGVVGPSQEIYESIKSLDQKIPVIISMGSLAASGGYYAALGGRKIFANPGTLTASIGVIMEFINTERLLDWAKVERYAIKSGRLKDIGSPSRKMLPEEKLFLQSLLDDVGVQFRKEVQNRRNLTDAELNEIADGRIMTGAQAKKAKLVDALGGYQEAVKEAKALSGLNEQAPVIIKAPSKGIIKDLLLGDSDEEESRFDRIFNALSNLSDYISGSAQSRILYLSAQF